MLEISCPEAVALIARATIIIQQERSNQAQFSAHCWSNIFAFFERGDDEGEQQNLYCDAHTSHILDR
jgi:hypothetical protein